ncbi:MAG TPA: DUF4097 family beta strand repeat-containing protein [Opitutaceae bacterium]|nr:DUF4097 family beta strand repeat-containing protein [Opitutaceae bacterium]
MNPKILIAFAAIGALSPLVVQAKIERTVEKTFTVSPGGTLKVETSGGNINVSTGDSDQVKVVAHERFRTDSESEADDVSKQLRVEIEQHGNDVSAFAKYEGAKLGGFWHSGSTPVYVSFDVIVPKKYEANLKTSGGNIEVADLNGAVDAKTSGGNIKLGDIDGKAEVRTSGGNIEIRGVTRSVDANTSGGDIRVSQVDGDASLHTSGGNIHVDSAGGILSATTSGGDVSATFARAPKGDCELRTSGGNVTAKIGAEAAVHLDASTSGGAVRVSGSGVDVQSGGNGKSKLVANVRGGGPTLTLRTSGGDVRIAAD